MYGFNAPGPYPNVPPITNAQFGGVFGQPMVQDMALQYGQQVCVDCDVSNVLITFL